MKNNFSILGSTGSIGLTTLNLISKKKSYKINLLSANKNYEKIIYQIRKFKPNYFLINDQYIYLKIKKKLKKNKTIILNSLKNIKIKKSQVTISAIPGIAGLKPTISLIKFSKKLVIANKESIICGWELIRKEARKFKTVIVPADSEHFSIMELIKNHKQNEIKKIYLTASGGPFLNFKKKKLKKVKPSDALKHPKWKMGKKFQ